MSSFQDQYLPELAPIIVRNETWRALASADIRSKYRRTALGPWWITLSNALFALIVGTVSGNFLGAEMRGYLPFFVTSITIWGFFSSCLTEGSGTLINAGGQIKSSTLPIAFHIMRMVQRNFIILLHNLMVIPLIWVIFPWHLSWTAIISVLGIVLIYIIAASVSLIFSIVCVRYRDMPPLIQTIVQFMFFVSPIIWMPDQLHGGHLILRLNPIGHLLSLARDPILSRPVTIESVVVSVLTACVSVAAAAIVYVKYKNRVVFWV